MTVRHFLPLCLLTTALLLTGCAAQQHVRDADRYMQLHDYASAVAHYRQALALEPSYAEDVKFVAAFHEAQRQDALTAADAMLSANQPQNAVDRLESALRDLPGEPSLLAKLTAAKHASAELLHTRALDAADQGRLDAAKIDLQNAMKYEPQHAAATLALQSLSGPAHFPSAVQQQYATAQQAMTDHRWDAAARTLGDLIAASPDFLPARADAFTVSQQIAQTQQHLTAATKASDAKQLDAAIGELKAALTIWPEHSGSAALLNDVVARKARVVEITATAAYELEAKHYDSAITTAQSALALYPVFTDAQRIEAMARQSAANDAVTTGNAALQKADFPAANGAFSKALGYLPKMPEAKAGLAAVASAQADIADKAGRIGLALLYRMQAYDQLPDATHRGLLNAAHQRVAEKGAFALVIDGRNTDAQVAAQTAPFASALSAQLAAKAPAILAINPVPAPTDRPVFRAMVTVVQATVSQAMTDQKELTQAYNIATTVPNPDIPGLHRQLEAARSEYDRLKRRTDERERGLRNYQATADHNAPDYQAQRSHIDDLVREARHDSDNARRDLDRAADALRSAPKMVIVEQPAAWPYIRQHYQRTATVAAVVNLSDAANHALTEPMTVNHSVTADDDTTLQPNPPLGVAEDPLSLPDGADMQQQATNEGAAEATEKLLDAALRTRESNLQAQADELRKAGKNEQALELDVAAAVVQETIDSQQAARRMAELRRSAAQ